MRRPANPYRDSKPHNNRLSVGVRAQQRHSPRGPNGDRVKPPKAKDKKETKEAPVKPKDDKVDVVVMVLTNDDHMMIPTLRQSSVFPVHGLICCGRATTISDPATTNWFPKVTHEHVNSTSCVACTVLSTADNVYLTHSSLRPPHIT